MNIILLVVDTLRYDRIRFHGACPHIETPNFDRIAERSLVCDRAFASSYPTIPHRTDVMTGRSGSPFHPWAPLAFDQTTLPGILADKGYCTQLMHDTPHLVNGGHAFDYPFHAWTFVRGAEVDRPLIDDKPLTMLDNWRLDDSLPVPASASKALSHRMIVTYTRANRNRSRPEDWNAARLFTAASDFLTSNASRDNFFLWLDCFDPHEPWDAPPEYVRKYDTTEGYDGSVDPRLFTWASRHAGDEPIPEPIVKRQTAMYDAKVTWADHWLGHLLDTLERTGLDKNTALVVTADHGTSLCEWGSFGKSGRPPHEQEAHVPLLVSVPGGQPGRSNRIVQPQDIHATILDIAGAEAAGDCMGRSVLDTTAPERNVALCGASLEAWSEATDKPFFSVFDRDRYLALAVDPACDRLYDYGTTSDIAKANPEHAAKLRGAALDELVSRGAPGDVIDWLRTGGTTKPPACIGRNQKPAGWDQYFNNTWARWE